MNPPASALPPSATWPWPRAFPGHGLQVRQCQPAPQRRGRSAHQPGRDPARLVAQPHGQGNEHGAYGQCGHRAAGHPQPALQKHGQGHGARGGEGADEPHRRGRRGVQGARTRGAQGAFAPRRWPDHQRAPAAARDTGLARGQHARGVLRRPTTACAATAIRQDAPGAARRCWEPGRRSSPRARCRSRWRTMRRPSWTTSPMHPAIRRRTRCSRMASA